MRIRRLLRTLIFAVAVVYAGVVAVISVGWSSISPYPAAEWADSQFQTFANIDDLHKNLRFRILRLTQPTVALLLEAKVLENSRVSSSDIPASLRAAAERYKVAGAQDDVFSATAMVRHAALLGRSPRLADHENQTVELLKRAYAAGNPRAAFEVAKRYENGQDPDGTFADAVAIYRKYADLIPEAAQRLAELYQSHALETPYKRVLDDLQAQAERTLLARVTESGSVTAMLQLAKIFEGGITGSPNYQAAAYWLNHASARGSEQASYSLALLYEKPDTGIQDLGLAAGVLSKLAQSGNIDAIVKFASYKLEGKAVPLDRDGAKNLYRTAAERGSAIGKFRYATVLLEDRATTEDIDNGMTLLKQAAEDGHGGAALKLAQMFEEGIVPISKNSAEALKWYRRAAERGSATAQARLSQIFEDGELGQKADEKQRLEWALRAVENGRKQRRMLREAGIGLLEGKNLPVDRARGFQYLKQAADLGDVASALPLARCYAYGVGIEQNPALAIEWYNIAAKSGRIQAYYELGRAYASGFGGTFDPKQAYDYFLLAADSDHALAMVELGRMFVSGFGVMRNYAHANMWFEKAAKLGNIEGIIEFANMQLEGLAPNATPKRGIDTLRAAADRDEPRAQYILALEYLAGRNTPKDVATARDLLERARALHHAPAKARLRLLDSTSETLIN